MLPPETPRTETERKYGFLGPGVEGEEEWEKLRLTGYRGSVWRGGKV